MKSQIAVLKSNLRNYYDNHRNLIDYQEQLSRISEKINHAGHTTSIIKPPSESTVPIDTYLNELISKEMDLQDRIVATKLAIKDVDELMQWVKGNDREIIKVFYLRRKFRTVKRVADDFGYSIQGVYDRIDIILKRFIKAS